MTTRFFPALTLMTLGLTATGPTKADCMEPNVRKIVILHSNDIHGHLTAWTGWEGELKGKTVGGLVRLAGAVAQAHKENEEAVLLLDAGDLIGDTMLADLTEGKAHIEALNYLRYDALAVGNHERDFSIDILRQRSKEAQFPLLAGNLVAKGDGSLFAEPYVVKKVNGVTVGVLGLAYPHTNRTTAKKNVDTVAFQDPAATVKRFLPRMRDEGAEVKSFFRTWALAGTRSWPKPPRGST
jgi:2',3'-cyclic-nucleotide 2'-phosphodiesterase (5'-nucleotidase family)